MENNIKVGDLVVYKGWKPGLTWDSNPMGIVLETRHSDTHYHSRIRIMWLGETVPIQAQVFSTTGDRISSWISPKHFDIVNVLDDHVK